MSQILNYSEALWPDRVRIFGRLLRPYCIGHALLLHRIGSPFLRPAKRGLGDLLCALDICSRPWQSAARGLASGLTRWRLQAWNWQVQTFSRFLDLGAPQEQFERYLAEAWEGPSVWEEIGDASEDGAPALILLKVGLCAKLRMSDGEALSTPVRKSLYELQAYLDMHGQLDFVSDEDIAAIERAARQ